jgi:hypothetical protein
VLGAGKLNRTRLIRFALESILGQTLNGREIPNLQDGFDEVPIMPPATYQAVEQLMKVGISESRLICSYSQRFTITFLTGFRSPVILPTPWESRKKSDLWIR